MAAPAPKRRAASAWPSSWTRMEAKTTAVHASAVQSDARKAISGTKKNHGSTETGNGPSRNRRLREAGGSSGGSWAIRGNDNNQPRRITGTGREWPFEQPLLISNAGIPDATQDGL